jgi:DNA segregation ATPase FtsK/SpoIIIE, S-DNA-T family
MERIDEAAALHRQAAAVAQAAARALDEHVPMPRTDLAMQRDLALRLREAAARLTPGWLGGPLDETRKEGERARPEFVRVGEARPVEHAYFPAIVPLVGTGHLTFSADSRDTRVAGALRCVLLRLLATAPAGTLIVRAVDAVGGALFAPFAVLADAGVMPPAVTERVGLNAVLAEAEHWVAPDRPNEQRRPDARPRRRDCTMLLLVAALPSTVSSEELNRIAALAGAGPGAGLHVIAAGWPPMPFSHRPALPLLAASTHITMRADHALLGGAVFTADPENPGLGVPVRLDPDPPGPLIQRVCDELAKHCVAQGEIHVTDLLPDPEHWWAENSAEGMSTTVGMAGETPVSLHFTDLTPHWLVGGRVGAGKTAFLIDVLYGLCTRYDPEELQLYLVDCSAGGALRQFAPTEDDPSWLPHAVDVSVDSDRSSALDVLRSLNRELQRRIAMLNDAGATRFHQLRAAGAPIPRIVCVIDEFQDLLTGTDETAIESASVLESLARQGRAAGMHLVMCSQRARSSPIFQPFLVRVALPGGGDVLEATNDAAASLPLGLAVVNTAGGLGGPRGATRGHEKTVRFADPHADEEVLAALRQRLWQAREPASAPPQVRSHVPAPRPGEMLDQEVAHE